MGKNQSNKSLYFVYAVLGSILLTLLVLIGISLFKGSGHIPPKVIPNQLEKGNELCNEASSIFLKDREKACEALALLEEGIVKIETELNKYRDKEGNLPSKYTKHDTTLTEWLSLRKGFREQCFIEKEKKERKSGGN